MNHRVGTLENGCAVKDDATLFLFIGEHDAFACASDDSCSAIDYHHRRSVLESVMDCGSCKWWAHPTKRNNIITGECRLKAPVFDDGPYDKVTDRKWPRTSQRDFCGEHELRKEKTEET